MHRRDRVRSLLAICGIAVTVLVAGCGDRTRQDEVADRGASVMPFDLERTTHQFVKTDAGGVQTVVADDPADSTQISLIRRHLGAEAERFRRGDFADPARIHGTGMPGLQDLRAHGGQITIAYEDTPAGGRVTYTTGDAGLRTALHHWFDAQVGDHGRHATG